MNRFYTIEDARENFSYIDEDLEEVQNFIEGGNHEMAVNVLESIVANLEDAVKQFPEMETELKPIVAKVTPYALKVAVR